MSIIKRIVSLYIEKKKQRNEKCEQCLLDVDKALKTGNDWFADEVRFIDPIEVEQWQNEVVELCKRISPMSILMLKGAPKYKNLLQKQKILFDFKEKIWERQSIHNDNVVRRKVPEAYELIGEVEGRRLDLQQMTCVVKDMHNHLVIAGAGTGKTTTIVGKIKYLLMTKQFCAEDILVLSFTNASAAEMRERISKETGENIEASTFHKLGMNIISQVDGVKPKITNVDLRAFLKEKLRVYAEDDMYLSLLSTYTLYNRVVSKNHFDFRTKAEYDEYLELNPPTTFKGERVKSYGEMDIANFLYQNGIRYIYEKDYEFDTRTEEYGQYRPDFYLPDYNIYIEYFGINRDGEVPEYFCGTDEKSATQIYQESMEWKRNIHKHNGTKMIECFAYEKWEGGLLDGLKEKLLNYSVQFNPKKPREMWVEITQSDLTVVDGLVELLQTVINLMKSNNFSMEDIKIKARNAKDAHNNLLLLEIIEPLYNAYIECLKEKEEIDFNDMINLASQYVRENKYQNKYKCVIVDEYQDISKSRFGLLNNMRKSNNFDLFCVGDDWQSIYRFAGSDISFILNFQQYWGASEISRIETTYRFSQGLIDVSGNFIMRNPQQIKKQIKGNKESSDFAFNEIKGYNEKNAVSFMLEQLDRLPANSTVFMLGRYKFDVDLLKENSMLTCKYDNVSQMIRIVYEKRLDLQISFLTAHKSKGLQADYVFVLNNKNSRMGFPSKIQDAGILELLLENSDLYPYAEERRLFYVALTRAKKKVYLLTKKNFESVFALELRNRYKEEMKKQSFICPECGGRLFKKKGRYGEFLGCSNYSITGCEYTKNIRGAKGARM